MSTREEDYLPEIAGDLTWRKSESLEEFNEDQNLHSQRCKIKRSGPKKGQKMVQS